MGKMSEEQKQSLRESRQALRQAGDELRAAMKEGEHFLADSQARQDERARVIAEEDRVIAAARQGALLARTIDTTKSV